MLHRPWAFRLKFRLTYLHRTWVRRPGRETYGRSFLYSNDRLRLQREADRLAEEGYGDIRIEEMPEDYRGD